MNKFEKGPCVGRWARGPHGRRGGGNTSIDKRMVGLQLKDFPVHYKKEKENGKYYVHWSQTYFIRALSFGLFVPQPQRLTLVYTEIKGTFLL